MSKVIIVRGYCGTGKSSAAKAIVSKNDFAFLEYDNFLWNINAVNKPVKSDYEITFTNFLTVLKNYLKTNRNILIEGPLVPRTKDDPFDIKKLISIINKAGYKYKIIQLIASDRVCVRRMKKRNHIVPKWERDMFMQKHDTTIQKEEIVIDTSNLTIQQTINIIKRIL